jgi:hypothetical protein
LNRSPPSVSDSNAASTEQRLSTGGSRASAWLPADYVRPSRSPGPRRVLILYDRVEDDQKVKGEHIPVCYGNRHPLCRFLAPTWTLSGPAPGKPTGTSVSYVPQLGASNGDEQHQVASIGQLECSLFVRPL